MQRLLERHGVAVPDTFEGPDALRSQRLSADYRKTCNRHSKLLERPWIHTCRVSKRN